MKKGIVRVYSFCLLPVLLISSCVTSKKNYTREYAKVWKEVIKSEAWANALHTKQTPDTLVTKESVDFYVSTADDLLITTDETRADLYDRFAIKYHSLVSRAYFKIISEAQKADLRLKKEYSVLTYRKETDASLKKDKAFERNFEMVNKRYKAHTEMLRGLISWNIFSENRTGDLDYFKAENVDDIRSMYQNGKSEDAMINFLVYKLADLYHYE